MAVQLAPGQTPGELLASLSGRTLAVGVNARRTGRAAIETGAGAHGEQKIVAPMPGRVVRVLVAAGDAVEMRQPVIVVEAMKMENELRSPKAGTVRDVAVSAGASVEAGRVLVVID
jgi:biotin carboxyl carrier protein